MAASCGVAPHPICSGGPLCTIPAPHCKTETLCAPNNSAPHAAPYTSQYVSSNTNDVHETYVSEQCVCALASRLLKPSSRATRTRRAARLAETLFGTSAAHPGMRCSAANLSKMRMQRKAWSCVPFGGCKVSRRAVDALSRQLQGGYQATAWPSFSRSTSKARRCEPRQWEAQSSARGGKYSRPDCPRMASPRTERILTTLAAPAALTTSNGCAHHATSCCTRLRVYRGHGSHQARCETPPIQV